MTEGAAVGAEGSIVGEVVGSNVYSRPPMNLVAMLLLYKQNGTNSRVGQPADPIVEEHK